jgi:hypothetical protein
MEQHDFHQELIKVLWAIEKQLNEQTSAQNKFLGDMSFMLDEAKKQIEANKSKTPVTPEPVETKAEEAKVETTSEAAVVNPSQQKPQANPGVKATLSLGRRCPS